MFGDKRKDVEKYLIKKGYESFKFIKKNGNSYFYEVRNLWRGKHIIKVKESLFGFSIEVVSN